MCNNPTPPPTWLRRLVVVVAGIAALVAMLVPPASARPGPYPGYQPRPGSLFYTVMIKSRIDAAWTRHAVASWQQGQSICHVTRDANGSSSGHFYMLSPAPVQLYNTRGSWSMFEDYLITGDAGWDRAASGLLDNVEIPSCSPPLTVVPTSSCGLKLQSGAPFSMAYTNGHLWAGFDGTSDLAVYGPSCDFELMPILRAKWQAVRALSAKTLRRLRMGRTLTVQLHASHKTPACGPEAVCVQGDWDTIISVSFTRVTLAAFEQAGGHAI